MEHLESYFKDSSFKDREFPVNEEGWFALEQELDQKNNRRILGWWIFGTGLIVGIAALLSLQFFPNQKVIEAFKIPLNAENTENLSVLSAKIQPAINTELPESGVQVKSEGKNKANEAKPKLISEAAVLKVRQELNLVQTSEKAEISTNEVKEQNKKSAPATSVNPVAPENELPETKPQLINPSKVAKVQNEVVEEKIAVKDNEATPQIKTGTRTNKTKSNYKSSDTGPKGKSFSFLMESLENQVPVKNSLNGGTSITKIAPQPIGSTELRNARTPSWSVKLSYGFMISNEDNFLPRYSTTPINSSVLPYEYSRLNGERLILYPTESLRGKGGNGNNNFYLYRLRVLRQFKSGFGVSGGLIYGRMPNSNGRLVEQSQEFFSFQDERLEQFWMGAVGLQYNIVGKNEGRLSGHVGLNIFKTFWGKVNLTRFAVFPERNITEIEFISRNTYGWSQGLLGYFVEGGLNYAISDHISVGVLNFFTFYSGANLRYGGGIELGYRF